MFNTVSNTVTYALNKDVNHSNKKAFNDYVLGVVVALTLTVMVNFVLGPWLWNNVLRRLVPVVGKARYYDTVLLSVLMSLIFVK